MRLCATSCHAWSWSCVPGTQRTANIIATRPHPHQLPVRVGQEFLNHQCKLTRNSSTSSANGRMASLHHLKWICWSLRSPLRLGPNSCHKTSYSVRKCTRRFSTTFINRPEIPQGSNEVDMWAIALMFRTDLISCHRTFQLIVQVDQRPVDYQCQLITTTCKKVVPAILVQIFLHGHVAS
jgi:hypothetical protein